MEKKHEELFKYISNTDENCAMDIMYSLELVRTSLESTMERIKREITVAVDNNSFDGVSKIAEYCKQIAEIDAEINQLLSCITSDRKEIVVEELRDTVKKRIVNYSDYDTDCMVPHQINEDFEHKKICKIKINENVFEVHSWQEALMKVCGMLYEMNSKMIYVLMEDKRFKKKKTSLFMKQLVVGRNKHLPGTDVYVWTNNSATTIAKQIAMLAEIYKIPQGKIEVYLYRDFTELHT